MNKKRIIFITFVAVLCLAIITVAQAYNKWNDFNNVFTDYHKDEIFGNWQEFRGDRIISFFKDGLMKYHVWNKVYEGQYDIIGNKLIILEPPQEWDYNLEWHFHYYNPILILTSNEDTIILIKGE